MGFQVSDLAGACWCRLVPTENHAREKFPLMNLTIRNAAASDIPTLVVLMEEFHGESGYPLDRTWADATFAALLADGSRGAAWILFDGTEPAGFVVLTVRFSMEYGGLDSFVDDLFVRPNHRCRGLGHLAMQTVLRECQRRGVLALHVEVGRTNAAAQGLYASHGLGLRGDDRQLLTMRLPANETGSGARRS